MKQTNTTEILKALADDVRLGLVKNLAANTEPTPSCDVVRSCASFLQLSQPAISHHFKKLVDAGVITEHKRGTQKLYIVNSDMLNAHGIDVSKL